LNAYSGITKTLRSISGTLTSHIYSGLHHDLSWNPSTLEQRTGGVDRIGAKAEVVSKPIQIFMPYIGGTQDEKQYRVVMDRERRFADHAFSSST
jgi:hypothetical protein